VTLVQGLENKSVNDQTTVNKLREKLQALFSGQPKAKKNTRRKRDLSAQFVDINSVDALLSNVENKFRHKRYILDQNVDINSIDGLLNNVENGIRQKRDMSASIVSSKDVTFENDNMKLTGETKALSYKIFFLKAFTKRLWKLTIKTKQLSQLKSLSFHNFNN